MKAQRIGVVCVAVVLAMSVGAWADTIDWAAGVDGDFNDGTKWTGGNPPGVGDDAIFKNKAGTAYTVTLTQNEQTDSLLFEEDRLNLALGGFTYAVGSIDLGNAYGGSGTIEFTPSNGTVSCTGNFDLGSLSWGGGATMNVGAGTTVTVGGNLKMSKDRDCDSFLNVTGGGSLTVAGTTSMGGLTMDESIITVSGAGSTASFQTLYAGDSSTSHYGQVKVLDGGSVTATTVYIGYGKPGQITVDGNNSSFTATALNISVKYNDLGSILTVKNGGSATINGAVVIGRFNYASTGGHIEVGCTGSGTLAVTGSMTIGKIGSGDCSVTVGAGGTAGVAGNVTVESIGTLDLALGEMTVGGNLDVNTGTAGAMEFEFDATDYGKINVTGSADIHDVYIEFIGGGLTGGETGKIDFLIANEIDAAGMTSNIDTVMAGLGFTAGNWSLNMVDDADAGDNDVLRLTYAPEPTTMGLLCLGGALMLRRKRCGRV